MNNNTTNIPSLCFFDGIARKQSSVSYAVTISASVIISILSPIPVAGNTLILAANWKNPSFRTPSYILLCGLVFADLCTGFITQPFYVVAELICLQKPQKLQDRLSLLRFAKVVSEGCRTFFNSMTVLLITMMSIERWMYMTRRSLDTVREPYSILIVVVTCPVPIAI